MSWIRSESGLPRHPKTLFLKKLLGVEIDATVGRLHLLWWWCLEYAFDGDLSKKEPKVIEESCQVPLKLLIRAGFVDLRPYRRIHDWWENQGSYLQSRFNKTPEKWQRIKHLYERQEGPILHGSPSGPRMGVRNRTDVTDVRTYVQNVRTDVDVKKLGVGSLPGLTPGVPLPESEMMSPEEMKAIRLKTLGEKPKRISNGF